MEEFEWNEIQKTEFVIKKHLCFVFKLLFLSYLSSFVLKENSAVLS